MLSAAPPAANGTTTRTGFAGHSAAPAPPQASATAAKVATLRIMSRPPVSSTTPCSSHPPAVVRHVCPPRPRRPSLALDVLLLHDAAPAGELVAQELAELRARGRRRNGAGLHELLAHVRQLEHADHSVVQLRHHRGRRLRRRKQAVPV